MKTLYLIGGPMGVGKTAVGQELKRRLDVRGCEVKNLSIICSRESLARRLEGDIAAGLREPDVVGRSLERLSLYEKLDTRKVDTTGMTAAQAAEAILGM